MHQSDAFVESAPSGLGADLGNQRGEFALGALVNRDAHSGVAIEGAQGTRAAALGTGNAPPWATPPRATPEIGAG